MYYINARFFKQMASNTLSYCVRGALQIAQPASHFSPILLDYEAKTLREVGKYLSLICLNVSSI